MRIDVAGVLVVWVLTVASGCAPLRYEPDEYPLSTERIPPFPSRCPVQVVNDQPSTASSIVTTAGWNRATSLHDVTQALADQLTKELVKRGCAVTPDAPKVIRLRVDAIKGLVHFVTLEGVVDLTYQLGGRPEAVMKVNNKSPANVFRALNGAIARTVIALLTDPDVLEYLAAAPRPAVASAAPSQP